MTARGWCFTWFLGRPGGAPCAPAGPESCDVKYVCWQHEKTKEGKEHRQGYIETKKPVRMAGVKSTLEKMGMKGCHIERRKGTADEAVAYCKKLDSAVPGTIYEWGTLGGSQGRRSDLEAVADLLRKGAGTTKVAEDCTTAYIKYYRGIEHARQMLNKPAAWRPMQVTVVYGTAGAGKTRFAYEDCKGPMYALASTYPEWWDGYDGEESLLIDDYYGGIPYARLLRILDGYPLQLPVKGGFVWARYTKVYITSNNPWRSWYEGHTDVSALERRLTRVNHMVNASVTCDLKSVTVTEVGGNTTPPLPENLFDELYAQF